MCKILSCRRTNTNAISEDAAKAEPKPKSSRCGSFFKPVAVLTAALAGTSYYFKDQILASFQGSRVANSEKLVGKLVETVQSSSYFINSAKNYLDQPMEPPTKGTGLLCVGLVLTAILGAQYLANRIYFGEQNPEKSGKTA